MSIYPTSKSFDETSRFQNVEINKASVPEEYSKGADAIAERLSEEDLASRSLQD